MSYNNLKMFVIFNTKKTYYMIEILRMILMLNPVYYYYLDSYIKLILSLGFKIILILCFAVQFDRGNFNTYSDTDIKSQQ